MEGKRATLLVPTYYPSRTRTTTQNYSPCGRALMDKTLAELSQLVEPLITRPKVEKLELSLKCIGSSFQRIREKSRIEVVFLRSRCKGIRYDLSPWMLILDKLTMLRVKIDKF